MIGESTFTIQSIFVFFLILFLSGLISSIVTFFASGEQACRKRSRKKRRHWQLASADTNFNNNYRSVIGICCCRHSNG